MWTENFQMFKLDLAEAEEPEIKLPKSVGSWKQQERSRKNIYLSFIDYAKASDCVDHNKLWKILQEMGYQTTWPASWEICMQVKKHQLKPVKTMNWLQTGKLVHQGCILKLAYLT